MEDKVYKKIELTGTSKSSVEEAVQIAISEAFFARAPASMTSVPPSCMV